MESNLNKTALSATLHCLTGCSIGEVLGLVIGTALGWSNIATILLAVALAFFFGYTLTLLPLLKHGMTFSVALGTAFVSDTASIAVMEFVDNAVVFFIPGAMDAGIASPLYWFSLALALALAGIAAYPVNRFLIARGQGHALVHARHNHH